MTLYLFLHLSAATVTTKQSSFLKHWFSLWQSNFTMTCFYYEHSSVGSLTGHCKSLEFGFPSSALFSPMTFFLRESPLYYIEGFPNFILWSSSDSCTLAILTWMLHKRLKSNMSKSNFSLFTKSVWFLLDFLAISGKDNHPVLQDRNSTSQITLYFCHHWNSLCFNQELQF